MALAIEKSKVRREKQLADQRQHAKLPSVRHKINERRREKRRAEGGSSESDKLCMLKYQWEKQGIVGMDHHKWNTLADLQGFVCPICRGVLEAETGKANRLHVDHDHATGQVRGLLCGRCNVGLGGFRDSPELLRTAAVYIERHSAYRSRGVAYWEGRVW